MTSPVDTSVKYFHSNMPGAPILNGVAGSLIALLDACLVNGFDTKTLTSLVAASGVMTATFSGTSASLQDAVVLIAGVTGGPTGWAGANGEQKIVDRPTATTATWATTLPDGTYSGTVTMRMAPAGWLKPYSGTNLAAYKSADVASTGMYLRVDDTNAQFVRVVGYESMSDVNTGTGPFPTPTQIAGGGYWAKSIAATTAAVSWLLATDGRKFFISIQPGTSQNSDWTLGVLRGFGDDLPKRAAGDAFLCSLSYSTVAILISMYDNCFGSGSAVVAAARAWSGIGGSALHQMYPYVGTAGSSSGTTGTLGGFPNPVDGSLYVCKRYLAPPSQTYPRGDLPGYLYIPQSSVWDTLRFRDRVTGISEYVGRNFVGVSTNSANSSSFQQGASINTGSLGLIDVTGPWR